MAILNNNAVAELLQDMYKQATGKEPEGVLDLSTFIDKGDDGSILMSKEQFTKALVVRSVKNWFTDSAYGEDYNDPFFQNTARYGAITQMVAIDVPDVQASHAWKEWENGDSVGTYEVYLPVVHTQYYGKTSSWELPITITYEQWDDAVQSLDGLTELVNYIFMVVDNKIKVHLEACNMANRNNFIAEKIAYSALPTAKGIHKVNLVEEAAKAFGLDSLTVSAFRQDPKYLRKASSRMKLIFSYLKKMTTIFNTAGYQRFTPTDRLVVQVLSEFAEDLNSVLLSDTFHDDLVALPKYEEVPFWQALQEENENALDFNAVSTIDVKIKDGESTKTIKQSGIVALCVDQWAIIHTLKHHRVATKNFDPEALDNYYYQFRDSYMNNLTMNGVVFVLEDYTKPSGRSTSAAK